MPDMAARVMGTERHKSGITSLFELLQQPRLNKQVDSYLSTTSYAEPLRKSLFVMGASWLNFIVTIIIQLCCFIVDILLPFICLSLLSLQLAYVLLDRVMGEVFPELKEV